MSSNLKVNTILPSTGGTIGIGTVGGLINVVGNIDVNSTSGISTFNNIEIADKIIHTGDTNTAIRFPDADTISFETGGSTRAKITSTGNFEMPNDNDYIKIGAGGDLQLVHTGSASYISNSTGFLEIQAPTITFENTSGTERARIDSSGRVLIGTTTAGYSDLDDLTIATSGNTGITIRSGTSSLGVIGFADGTSGNTQYRGVIQYNHSSDAMEFNTADAQRMRILGDGRVLINTSDGAAFSSRKLTVADTSSGATTAIEIRSATNGSGRLYFTDSTSSGNAGSYAGKVFYDHNTDYMGFYTGGGTNTPGERMKIDAYGRVTTPNQPSFMANFGGNNNVSHNNGDYLKANNTDHNTGNCYNTSNYRFTAPVAGNYLFYGRANMSGVTTNDYARSYQVRLYKNGSSEQFHMARTTLTGYSGSYPDTSTMVCSINLAANDYVQLKIQWEVDGQGLGSTENFHHHGSMFGGYLIG